MRRYSTSSGFYQAAVAEGFKFISPISLFIFVFSALNSALISALFHFRHLVPALIYVFMLAIFSCNVPSNLNI